jgi:hypothetical protein
MQQALWLWNSPYDVVAIFKSEAFYIFFNFLMLYATEV